MKLGKYSLAKLKKELLAIFARHLDLKQYRVFLFGSRVRGDNFDRSDIDVGVEGPAELNSSDKLQIEEEIDRLPTLYKFDLVDFKTVSAKFRKEALNNVEYLNRF